MIKHYLNILQDLPDRISIELKVLTQLKISLKKILLLDFDYKFRDKINLLIFIPLYLNLFN